MRRIRRVASRYDDMILASNNLWGYWPLGEFTGTRAADLGRLRADGVYTGGYTLGKSGIDSGASGVLLNGTTGYVNVAHQTALNQGDTGSWEIWLKRNRITQSTNEVLWDKGANSGSIGFEISGDHFGLFKDNAGQIVLSTVTVTDTTRFHHIVATKNGATSAKLYLDGVDVSGTVTDFTLANTTFSLTIGANQGPALFTNGTFLRAALYGRAITAGEVKEHYTVGLGA